MFYLRVRFVFLSFTIDAIIKRAINPMVIAVVIYNPTAAPVSSFSASIKSQESVNPFISSVLPSSLET